MKIKGHPAVYEYGRVFCLCLFDYFYVARQDTGLFIYDLLYLRYLIWKKSFACFNDDVAV